MRLATAF
ncbi:hypothetical protein YPPY56_4783, partial [Yersinia pestis PY-56]